MRNVLAAVVAVVVLAAVFVAGIYGYEEGVLATSGEPADAPALAVDQQRVTVNTTRVGADDPVQTAPVRPADSPA